MKEKTKLILQAVSRTTFNLLFLAACSILIGFLMWWCARSVHMTPAHQRIMGVAMGGLFFIRELFLVVLNPKYKYEKRGE